MDVLTGEEGTEDEDEEDEEEEEEEVVNIALEKCLLHLFFSFPDPPPSEEGEHFKGGAQTRRSV